MNSTGILAILVAILIVVAVARLPVDDVLYFDCGGKTNGAYVHPTDCTRFILCSHGRASDMPCGDCDLSSNKCKLNGKTVYDYTVYDVTTERCIWPADAPAGVCGSK
eukprot:TRINITY_DN656_c0_g1_i1.p1 TRINITY_DN656_c0_g1~~TRINITY_DN656_c0_g1_i1.p1  ORF type:complete len:107 (+),score=8.51 TRINITY_DN656_c0_g1_i1:75-395(+)